MMSSSVIDSDQTMHTATFSEQTRWPAAVATLGLAGLALSAYLSWSALTASPIAGCSAGDVFNCEHVFSSHWSKIVGIPVGVPAF